MMSMVINYVVTKVNIFVGKTAKHTGCP